MAVLTPSCTRRVSIFFWISGHLFTAATLALAVLLLLGSGCATQQPGADAVSEEDADSSLWSALVEFVFPSSSGDVMLNDGVVTNDPGGTATPVFDHNADEEADVSSSAGNDQLLWDLLTDKQHLHGDRLADEDAEVISPAPEAPEHGLLDTPPKAHQATPLEPTTPPNRRLHRVNDDSGNEDGSDADGVSLAFVFDSTGSMHRDLEQLKRGANAILAAMLARPDKPIRDYVFVPFNDPGVGPASVTTDPDKFRAQLEAVQVHGGFDCPEPALGALLQALQLVRQNSFIYVFTDASAKDHFLLPNVLSLVQRKQSKVVFVMTGNCKDSNTPRYQSIENIASASSGQVYHINKTEVENVLSFVRQTLDSKKVNLVSVDVPNASFNEYDVQVDETIREFTVSVSGVNPQISVLDPAGTKVDKPPAFQSILDLDNVKVVAVKDPGRGAWKVETSSDSKHAVRLTGLSVVDFSYGFSTLITDNLNETYHRPLKGASNFLLVGAMDAGSIWNLTSADLVSINGSVLQNIPLLPLGALDGHYRGGPFVPPEDFFYLANAGYGRDGYPIKRITPTAISAQTAGLPVLSVPSERVVWIGHPLILRCQIDSLVPFSAWWFKKGVPVSKKHKYQQTALMTFKVDPVTEETGGEYVCRASNLEGHSSESVNVIVIGPPPEVTIEAELQVSPQHPAILDCIVRSQLNFNVTWVRVNSVSSEDYELVENNARYIIHPNHTLVIDPALPDDQGSFSCIAENRGGKKESRTHLIVGDPLHVHVFPEKFSFQEGESFSVVCKASGSLPSRFYWEKDGNPLQVKDTGRVVVQSSGSQLVLLIKNAKLIDQAVYRCIGANERESAEAYVEGYYVELPTVKIDVDHDILRAGDEYLFKCTAFGIPRPSTRWLWEGLELDSKPHFEALDDGSLWIHNVQSEDAGQLDCVAHNSVGEVKDSINLTVGYAPSVLKDSSVLQLEIQGSGSLPCVGSGIPPPTVRWVRHDGKRIDLSRIQVDISSGSLLFSDADISDEGLYLCILENKFGQATSEGMVSITGVVPPEFEWSESNFQDVMAPIGTSLELLCHVSVGYPVPKIFWYKDGNQIDFNIELDGLNLHKNGSIVIKKVDARHSGSYKCEAVNVGGSAVRITQLKVMDPPILDHSEPLNMTEIVGSNAILPCNAHGTPQPEIHWLLSGNSTIALNERILRTYEGLVLLGVQIKDAGQYTCVAVNPAGSVNRTVTLIVQDPPHIVGEGMTEIAANLGEMIRLPCEASGEPSPEFSWILNNENIQYDDHFLPSANEDGLVITSIRVSDAGEYVCSATNTAGSANKTVVLSVQEPPFIDLSDSSEVTVVAGNRAEFSCEARGIPQPQILWTLHGQPLPSSNEIQAESNKHSLILTNVEESDSGTYVCTAYNVAGSDSRAFKLTVHVLPIIAPWVDFIKVVESEELIIDCPMSGFPSPVGTLSKDGIPLQISNFTRSSGITYQLRATPAAAGKYDCQAKNEAGVDIKVVNVDVIVPPRTLVPSNVSMKVVKGDDVELKCVEPNFLGNPPSDVIWTQAGVPISNSDSHFSSKIVGTLLVHNITPSEAGLFVCETHNEAGNSSRSFNITVNVSPVIRESFPLIKTLMEGEDFSMPCSADGNPKPSISWLINNHTISSDIIQEDDLLLMNDNTLVIISAVSNSAAIYSCVARNEEGEDRRDISIEVFVPPTMTNDGVIYEESKEGENVVLTCPVSDATSIQWRQNGEPIDFTANERSDEGHFKLLDGGRSLRIFETRPTDNGSYACIASNPVGQKEAKFYLEVLWAPYFEEFGSNQKEYTRVEGSSVTFDCLSSGSPTPKVIWKKNGTLPVTEHTTPGVIVSPSSRHALMIPSVRAHHDGLYQCQAINRVGRSSREFLLNVIVPPSLEKEEIDSLEVLRGGDVSLFCPISGFPQPQFEWRRLNESEEWLDRAGDRVTFENNTQLLIIKNVEFADSGFYVCNGTNQAGFKYKHFNISVLGIQNFTTPSEAPTVSNAEEDKDINVRDGDIISLECTAHGQPLPDIQWTHNGHTMQYADTHERFDLDSSSVTQTLTLGPAGTADAGKYICHASNSRGAAERVYRVRFQVAPRIEGKFSPLVENLTSVQGLPLRIRCPSVGEPIPKISWFKDGDILGKDDNTFIDGGLGETLHIKQIHKKNVGKYTCVAANNAGSVSKSFFLDVLVPPFLTSSKDEITKHVLRSESLRLECDFMGHPKPKNIWIKGGEPISFNDNKLHLADENHTLVILSVELNHAGRYSCVANNEAGSAELTFYVQVNEPPSRNEAVTRNFTSVTIRPHRHFILLCAMNGTPTPNISWYKDEMLLEPDAEVDNIQISLDGRQLHILEAQMEHEGLYQCSAENIVGSSDAFFQLTMEVPEVWGDWSEWKPCSATCGSGRQQRHRECQSPSCKGESSEERDCFLLPCPVNGGWSDWSPWTECPQSCGPSKRHRFRKCDNPEPAYGGLPCGGEPRDAEDCALPACVTHGGWSSWSEWSTCSVTCGVGVQTRHRFCNNPEPSQDGQSCSGSDADIAVCNLQPCSGDWSEWSAWTPCSSSCGSGRRQRHRECASHWADCVGDNMQYEYCKLRRCPSDGPRIASVRLSGNVNGRRLRNGTFFANISGSQAHKRHHVAARIHNVRKRELPLYPYMPLVMSPVSWNAAYEDENASNGFSLTKGQFSEESNVQFATGETIEMKHHARGVNHDGHLEVDIEVIGEVPLIQSKAVIFIQPFSEEYVQIGPSSLHASSEGTLSASGQVIPYSWNKTVFYDGNKGMMPYFTEKMLTENIETNYDPDLQEMRYAVSTIITRSFDENKCPNGFELDDKLQHCEDVNECLSNELNECHSTQLCENLLGSYRCSCPSGFRSLGIGQRCLDVNECLQEPPLCSDECRNVPGSYHCMCPPGTYLVKDRHSCSDSPYWDDPDDTFGAFDTNHDEASESGDNRGDSFIGSESDYMPQEFRQADEEWSCPDGFVRNDGSCEDMDECSDNPDICGEDETCLNMRGSFECIHTPCDKGYQREAHSRECIKFCDKEGSSCPSGALLAEKKVFLAVSLDSESSAPNTDLVHVSVSEDSMLPTLTKFYISGGNKGKPFHVRQESGSGVVYISKPLKQGKVHRVGVRADTYLAPSGGIIYSTKFVIYVYIGET